jgi:hypothetical protein
MSSAVSFPKAAGKAPASSSKEAIGAVPEKQVVGVPEITAVQGMVPTLQYVNALCLTYSLSPIHTQEHCRDGQSRVPARP